jgi:DNA-binding CsgD family transcriptional regulator
METTKLVGQIYESIGDPEALAETIRGMMQVSRSRVAQFGLLDHAGSWLQANVVEADQAVLGEYLERFASDDPRVPFLIQHPGRWIPCQQAIPDCSTFERSSLVNEFLDKHDARFALPAFFSVGPRHSAIFSFMRGRKDGHYRAEDVHRLDPFLPHLKRAITLHIRIGRLESTTAQLDALVDRLSAPVFLVDKTGLLLHANTAGLKSLEDARHVMLKCGRVRPSNPTHDSHFQDMMAATLSDRRAVPDDGHACTIRLFDRESHSTALVFHSLRGHVTPRGMPAADLVLFLFHPREEQSFDSTRLKVVFGLTDAEMRLAKHLLMGRNLPEIGEELGVGRETLKSQLRSLFAKTDTHRQGELIALLLSSRLVAAD